MLHIDTVSTLNLLLCILNYLPSTFLTVSRLIVANSPLLSRTLFVSPSSRSRLALRGFSPPLFGFPAHTFVRLFFRFILLCHLLSFSTRYLHSQPPLHFHLSHFISAFRIRFQETQLNSRIEYMECAQGM